MITFCIPSKNNLRYLKTCIKSIQENSHYKNDILVYVDQDNDGTCEWLAKNKIDHLINPDKTCKGIGYAYDSMFKAAKTDLVIAFHADMILGPEADYHLAKHHKRDTVVCSTRIEPPLHPPGPEKIVMDFGMWPEEIQWDDFNKFVKAQVEEKTNDISKSLFAPWLIHKEDHLGHDPIFLSVFEDADLFRRFKLAGYQTIQSWSSYVYHLTCRGGQFEHAKTNQDLQTKSTNWQIKNQLSLLEYIRKWGGIFKEDGPCEPRPNIKYNIGVKITNCKEELLSFEPFFDQLSVDCDSANYIAHQEEKTSFNIRSKFVDTLTTDIMLDFDANAVGSVDHFTYVIQNIEDIMQQVESNSVYEFGSIKLLISKIRPIQVKINLLDK